MSDVPEGYKMSEVGVIPEEWDVFEFGQLIDYTKGFAFKSKDYRADGIRIIRVSDTTFDSIKEENQIYIDEISSNQYQKWKLEEDDLVLSTVGSKPPLYDSMVGKVILIQKKYEGSLLNQNAVLIRSKKKTKFKQQILLHHFRTKKYLKYIESIFRGNANQASITLEELFQFQIPLPKLEEEQQAIASALSDVDALITALEQLITKKRNIKQGTMQQLLTGEKRLPGFGGAWEVKKLGEIAEITMGQSPQSAFYNTNGNGIPLIQGNADIEDRKTIIRTFTSSITKRCKMGDIIMSVRAPVGEIAKATFDACLGRGVCAISTKNDYLFHGLIFLENSWLRLSKGSTFDSIDSTDVIAMEIKMPPTEIEQKAIAQILSDMDTEIESLEQKRDKYKAIKQGMMQELLTGKTRVV